MKREIYTYTDIRQLRGADYYSELKKYPQITVSTDLQKGLKGSNIRESFGGVFRSGHLTGLLSEDNPVIHDFKYISEVILPKWTADTTKFRETIVLSEFFRMRISKADRNEKEKNWLMACRKNISSILSAIILLEECGISPNEIDAGEDVTLGLFLEAWDYLVEHDAPSVNPDDMNIKKFREIMEGLKSKEKWGSIFNKLYGSKHPQKLILHGFYYFTPLQYRIFNLMEKQGTELVFLFPYDERYQFVNEIWTLTYAEENGFPPKSDWHIMRSDKEESIGEIFEGNNVPLVNKLSIKRYDSIIEFADDIKRIKQNGYALYSTNFHTANAILRDFYPEEYGDRKLLSYPIGQFVNTLNHMWDDDRQTIILDEDSLIECFSSGWLMISNVSGKQYMQDLMYVLPFFSGCETIVEWEERIGQLESIQKTILEQFYENLDSDEAVARWQQVMGNPLNQFSPFSVDIKKLSTILALIKQLLEMAKELFGTNQPVRVKDHMNKLDYVLKRYEVSGDLYDEELKLVEEIFEKLDDPINATAKGYPSDIAAALNIYLTGRLDESEIQMNRVGLVMPMYQVDAAVIKNNSKVHVCFCDIDSMPGKKKHYVWPLNTGVIENVYAAKSDEDKKIVAAMKHVMEDSAATNRYFIYSALKNRDVELSYIANMRGEPKTPSPYIVMLENALSLDAKKAWKNHFISYSSVDAVEYAQNRIKDYDRKRMPELVPREARMDYAICPMKYILSYVVEKHPTYSNTFHQNYAINGLIAAIKALTLDEGISQDDIYENVIELFPHMRSVEKRQVKDYIYYEGRYDDMDFGNLTRKGDKYYTDERLKVFYPNRRVREAAVKQFGLLATPDGRQGLNLYETSEIENACIYCPHEDYCRNARFAVDKDSDQEAFYD